MKKTLIVFAAVFGTLASLTLYYALEPVDPDLTVSAVTLSALYNRIFKNVLFGICSVLFVANVIGVMIVTAINRRCGQTKAGKPADAADLRAPHRDPVGSAGQAGGNPGADRALAEKGGWICPGCGTQNDSSVSRCNCGRTREFTQQ
ncbi:MAG: zinc finger Ran-binding domain-containing protein [Oscillospiraceae bacterium]|nr:zinc finger Ran-binding domain-containing protein [Oscillospiraceae bacterium]